MAGMDDKRLAFALDLLRPSDGFEFEEFVNRFLAPEIPGLRPVAGMHDGARDAFIYEVDWSPWVFVQSSLRKDWDRKIVETTAALRKNGHQLRELIYCTSLDIQRHADVLRKSLRAEGVSLDIRDRNYFTAFLNTDVARVRAGETLANRFAEPILARHKIVTALELPLSGEEERLAAAYLQVSLAEKDPEKALTKFSYDSLVLHALRDTSPKAPLPRQALYAAVARVASSSSETHALVNAAVQRLIERTHVKHHTKEDAFTLSHLKRLEVQSQYEAFVVRCGRVQSEIEDRVKLVAAELGVDFEFNASTIAHDALTICHHILFAQGRAAAEALIHAGRYALPQSSIIDATERFAVDHKKQLTSLETHGLEHFLDLVPPVIENTIAKPSSDIRDSLRHAVDAYFLLFVLKETADVQSALAKLFGTGTILIDASILVPCMAETVLPEGEQRMSNLIRAATGAGIRLIVTDDVINELQTHLERVKYTYQKYTSQFMTRLGAPVVGLYESLLIATYVRLPDKSEMPTFEDFVDRFMGEDTPEQDVIDFLQETLGIEYDLMDNTRDIISDKRAYDLVEKWRELKRAQQRRRPWIDEHALDTLVRHDARALLSIDAMRASDRSSDVHYGHIWWWLTLDRAAYRMDEFWRNGEGTSLCMSPDFFARYLSTRPTGKSTEEDLAAKLPVSVEIAGVGLVPPDLRDQASQALAQVANMPPYYQRRKLRELVNKAKSTKGEIFEGGLADVSTQIEESITATSKPPATNDRS
jgi:hypothetical protein